MQQLEVSSRTNAVYAQRLRRVTEEYLYRVRLIALAQARSEARPADPRPELSRNKSVAA